ncbi:nucleotidyltransferase [Ilyomonas limi]|uniref:Cyclic GMP-AMP synthase n=1 Tax=Ilyomonas limi TaxID=2575867 RepID=A0A4U3KV75_9BACT|nr:nucleotidyltransferase [Ilyomonas limi]TKK66368.1 nucleotidyltransferase [Ilyomonas limi]
MGKIVQDQFIKFHKNIRLDMDDHRDVIAKRDMLIEEVRAYLKKMCDEKKIKLIRFESFNQGSYSMSTGIKPIKDEHDYDIDCGLLFEIDKDKYTSVQVKQWVFDALDSNQFRTVEWKKACIRVQYKQEGLPRFHVDFACYSNANNDGKVYLAKGKPKSLLEDKIWEVSDPKKLRDLINNRFSDDEECSQFKREIRYMKRWKDKQFSSKDGKPTGIAFTALAYNGFVPSIKDQFSWAVDINDLKATKDFVNYVLNQFGWDGRIRVSLPVPPGNDLFIKMTDQQCKTFKEKLESLKDSLIAAEKEADPHEACEILRKQFGDDFPVPPKEDTGQSRNRAVAGTSESA